MMRFLTPLLFAALGCTAISRAEDRKPNVLLLMADDLNTALSGFGHPQCKTPNLDRLAERGVRFESMHCQYPVCGASRASMMTGLYPYTNGMLGNEGNLRENLPDVVTMSQLFRQNGYHVGRVSKIYHMGIPFEIIDGTAEHDDPPSWDETVNIQALEQTLQASEPSGRRRTRVHRRLLEWRHPRGIWSMPTAWQPKRRSSF